MNGKYLVWQKLALVIGSFPYQQADMLERGFDHFQAMLNRLSSITQDSGRL